MYVLFWVEFNLFDNLGTNTKAYYMMIILSEVCFKYEIEASSHIKLFQMQISFILDANRTNISHNRTTLSIIFNINRCIYRSTQLNAFLFKCHI